MSARTRRIILTALALTIMFLGFAIMASSDNARPFRPHNHGMKPQVNDSYPHPFIENSYSGLTSELVDVEESLQTFDDTPQSLNEENNRPEMEFKLSEKLELMPAEMRSELSVAENLTLSEISEELLVELRTKMFNMFLERFGATVSAMQMSFDLEEIFDCGLFAVAAGVVSDQQRDDELHSRVEDTRSRIQNWIEANPGVHLRELQRCLGCSMGSVQYHLAQLEVQGTIRYLMNGNTKHLFPSNFSTSEQILQFTALVRNTMINQILKQVALRDIITRAELGRVLEVDVSVVSYYVNQLLEADVVKIIPVFGREKPLMITDWARDCLVSHGLLT